LVRDIVGHANLRRFEMFKVIFPKSPVRAEHIDPARAARDCAAAARAAGTRFRFDPAAFDAALQERMRDLNREMKFSPDEDQRNFDIVWVDLIMRARLRSTAPRIA
jgi:hypothetical protein